MVTRRYLVVGLPSSGKTTFIAALWHVVQAQEIPSALRLLRMTGDRTYLNELRDAWLQCREMPRTNPTGEKLVTMLLVDDNEVEHELWLPDISGETFQAHWAHREWAKGYDDLVGDADGVLLFVRPGALVEPLSITLANQLASVLDAPAPPCESSNSREAPVPWNPIESPTQVQLVDMLQILMWRRPALRWRLGVIVSAWDEVRGLGQSPEQWCRARLPILDQFLGSWRDRLLVRYYGVSAQGGPLPVDAPRLKAITYPSERIEVVVASSKTASNDVTLPVRDLAPGDA